MSVKNVEPVVKCLWIFYWTFLGVVLAAIHLQQVFPSTPNRPSINENTPKKPQFCIEIQT